MRHQIEPGNSGEIPMVARKQAAGVLQRLAGEPEILDAVTMLSAGRANLRG